MNWRTKLLRVLEDRNMTQYALAKATGITQPRISLWLAKEQGEPDLEQWGLMCRALDVPMTAFLSENLAREVVDNRTPEEQLLVRIARDVGVEAILKVLFAAAIRGGQAPAPPAAVALPELPRPKPGASLPPLREINRREEDMPPARDKGDEGGGPRPKPGGGRPRSKK